MLEYELSHTALGTSIILLSLLREANQPVTIQANSSYTLLHDIKRVFNLNWLTINTNDSLKNDLVTTGQVGDFAKFYSPYLPIDTITAFGQPYPTGWRNKPCIGLATYDLQFDFAHDNFPYNRLYTREIWAKIFQLCQHAGYDVITLNSIHVDFEKKTWMMNELCDCVIGYEGGMAHLAHVLKIPTVILPWRTWSIDDHKSKPTGDLNLMPHMLHIDRRTYFLHSVDELLAWNPHELKNKISQLYNNQGNNRYFTDAADDSVTPWLTRFEKEFIQTYIRNPAKETIGTLQMPQLIRRS
jgi:hypothetical protein